MAVSLFAINRNRDLDKSTTLFHLICGLSKRGLQVLLVASESHHWLRNQRSLQTAGHCASDGSPGEELPQLSAADAIPALARPTEIPGLSMICGASSANGYSSKGCRCSRHESPTDAEFQRLADSVHVILIENPAQAQLCRWSFLAPSDYMLCLADNLDSPRCLSVKMAVSSALRDLRSTVRTDGTSQHPCREMGHILADLWSTRDVLMPAEVLTDALIPVDSDKMTVEFAGDDHTAKHLIPMTAHREIPRRAA